MERFWSKVRKTRKCWEWTATRTRGYGVIRFAGKLQKAHRVAWQLERGEIPDGKLVLHKCDNPSCVRPSHLFLGTQADNMRDAKRKGRLRSGRPPVNATHCPHGHEFTPANTYINPRGYKVCRTCNNGRTKKQGATETHCKHGHPWDGNARVNERGYRICAACRAEANRRYHQRTRGTL